MSNHHLGLFLSLWQKGIVTYAGYERMEMGFTTWIMGNEMTRNEGTG